MPFHSTARFPAFGKGSGAFFGRNMACVITVMLGMGLTTEAYSQSLVDGFMRGKGKLDAALTYSHESYSQYFVGNNLVTNPLTGETTNPSNPNLGNIATGSFNLYLAHGIFDDLDVAVSLPYIHVAPDAGFWSSQTGFQDLSIAVKYRPLQIDLHSLGRLDLMAAAGFSTPIGDYIIDAPIAIGHGSTNGEFRLLGHYSTDFGPFVTLQGGYIRRSNVDLDRGFETIVPDAVDLIGKIGYASKLFYVDAWAQRQNAQEGTTIGPGVPFPSNAVSFTRIGLNAYYPIPVVEGLGITAGAAFTLDGRNIGKSNRFSGGITYGIDLY